MTTITLIEDYLRDSPHQVEKWKNHLASIQRQLKEAMCLPLKPAQYQQFTLLLEAAIQAEYILDGIYLHYHNVSYEGYK